MKKLLIVGLATLAILGVSFLAISARNNKAENSYNTNQAEADQKKPADEKDTLGEKELPVMTTDYVAKYDGKNGNRAYIIVKGIVYDVTDSPRWANGFHNGFEAGKDLTSEIENISPHGVAVLERMKKVGQISN